MVTAVDDLARAYELYPDEQIQEEAMNVLREMYGSDIPDPEDIIIPRWNIDPLYRGSYSNWPLGVLDDHHENLRQPVGEGRVMFTGEAMSPEAFGYVQGAWDEGIATADKIGKCLNGGDCENAEIYEALKTCAQTPSSEGVSKRGVSRMAKRNGSPRSSRVL
jgi:polyamine oxidase